MSQVGEYTVISYLWHVRALVLIQLPKFN